MAMSIAVLIPDVVKLKGALFQQPCIIRPLAVTLPQMRCVVQSGAPTFGKVFRFQAAETGMQRRIAHYGEGISKCVEQPTWRSFNPEED